MEHETRHSMSWNLIYYILFFSMFIRSSGGGALCPSKCRCYDGNLSTTCSNAGLEVIPLQLNPEIRYLDLFNNKISNLYYTLSIYENLLAINLSSNNLNSLGVENFKLQCSLQVLNISKNNIDKLRRDSFSGLKALTILDVSYNKLKTLHNTTFLELNSLQILILSGNMITHLESGLLKGLRYLKELLLDDNQFLVIPKTALQDTKSLMLLSLSNNFIQFIDDDSIPNLSNLILLSLKGNVIRDIQEAAFMRCMTLEQLDLSNNNFTNIPSASLSKLPNLTWLKLSGNFVQNIPPVAFRGLFQLKYIHLDHLDLLRDIDYRAFVDNINLERVWLNNNIGMKSIPTRIFHGNPKILYISIENNALTSIDAAHFPLDQLHWLLLGGNPLECNCSLLWLWNLANDQKKYSIFHKNESQTVPSELYIDFENIICDMPKTLRDKKLVYVKEYEISCSLSWISVTFSVFGVLFLCLILLGFILWGPLKIKHTQRDNNVLRNGILYYNKKTTS